MRILHTADWHLGQSFFDRDRLPEQTRFLDFLLEQIEQRAVDLLIVAGDVFDVANPPRAAEQAYYDFLTRLHASGPCEALIIGGNHDSAPHLDAPRRLLANLRIRVVGAFPEDPADALFQFERGDQRLHIAAVPFLRDRDVRRAIEGETFSEMEARTKAGILAVYSDLAQRLEGQMAPGDVALATGHLTAVGGQLSESERSIHIGHLGSIAAGQLSGIFGYVALGHLHHPQAVGGHAHIRYAGSPLPLSFSESAEKQIRLLTLEGGILSQEAIPIPLARRLHRLEGSAEEIETQLLHITPATGDELTPWVEATLTKGAPSPAINENLRTIAARNGLEVLKVAFRRTAASSTDFCRAEDLRSLTEWTPAEVFAKRLETAASDTPSSQLQSAFNHILHLVQEEAPVP
ncbi:MAG: exonuclease SbcCD subunit D C-terminal domain-containing protein [Opitutales bacterium]|nr:exonuclease SbcCD subunit D C-terminal domain-containing protein [Opitutales bacterium]